MPNAQLFTQTRNPLVQGWREVGLFLMVLLPFASAVSSVLMAVAIRCKSFKEAQAHSTVVMLAVTLLPMVSVFNQTGDEPWYLWVPALAQNILMMRVLKGDGFTTLQVVVPLFVCVLLTAGSLLFCGTPSARRGCQVMKTRAWTSDGIVNL